VFVGPFTWVKQPWLFSLNSQLEKRAEGALFLANSWLFSAFKTRYSAFYRLSHVNRRFRASHVRTPSAFGTCLTTGSGENPKGFAAKAEPMTPHSNSSSNNMNAKANMDLLLRKSMDLSAGGNILRSAHLRDTDDLTPVIKTINLFDVPFNQIRHTLNEFIRLNSTGHAGCYLIMDRSTGILQYVGQTVNLTRRVSAYLSPQQSVNNGLISRTIGERLVVLEPNNYFFGIVFVAFPIDFNRRAVNLFNNKAYTTSMVLKSFESVLITHLGPSHNVRGQSIVNAPLVRHPNALYIYVYNTQRKLLHVFVTKTLCLQALRILGSGGHITMDDDNVLFRDLLLLRTAPYIVDERPLYTLPEFNTFIETHLPSVESLRNTNVTNAVGLTFICVSSNKVLHTPASQRAAARYLGIPLTTLKRRVISNQPLSWVNPADSKTYKIIVRRSSE